MTNCSKSVAKQLKTHFKEACWQSIKTAGGRFKMLFNFSDRSVVCTLVIYFDSMNFACVLNLCDCERGLSSFNIKRMNFSIFDFALNKDQIFY